MSERRWIGWQGPLWRQHDAPRRRVWCWINIAAVLTAVAGVVGPAVADEASEPAEMAAPVTSADGLLALELVEGWLRRGSVDVSDEESLGRASRSGLFGVRVCLRLGGRVMGTGEAYRRDLGPGTQDADVDMVGLLRTAAEDAMSGARRRLMGLADRQPGEGRSAATAWASLTVSLELACARRRFVVGGGGAAGLAAAGWVSGVEGLRVAPRAGGGPGGVAWPGWALATNMGPERQLSSAMSAAGYEPGEALGMMAVPGRVLERFETVHAARPSVELWPVRYERGLPSDEPLGAATAADVERAGRGLTEHLLTRVTSDGGVLGDYEPGQDRWQPARSTGVSRAAVLLALTEARAAGWVVDDDWPRVEQAMRDASSPWTGASESGLGLAEGGMLLGALADPVWSAAWADRARSAGAARLDEQLWAADGADGSAWGVAEMMALWGLARASDRADAEFAFEDDRRSRLAEAVEAMLARGDVAGLWWLGRTRETLDGAERLPAADPAAEIRAAVALMSTQRLTAPEGGRRGEAGGLMGVEPAGALEPTWKTAAGLGWLSTVARRAEKPGDRFSLLLGVTQAAGFLERLQLVPTRLWYGVDRPAALHGVRVSLTDHALPAGPNAISLLALLEVLRTEASSENATPVETAPSTADAEPDTLPNP